LLKEGCNATVIHKRLVAVYDESARNYSTVTRWFNEFKRDRQSVEDDPRSGRPSDQGRSWVFVAEGVQKIEAPQAPRIRGPKVPLGTPTSFLIEFVQISGIHLIVAGGGGPEVRTPGQLGPCFGHTESDINCCCGKIILQNRREKEPEIAKELEISVGSVDNILHQHLHMSNVSALWVPEVSACKIGINELLSLYKSDEEKFCRRLVTGDET
jgi:hypothetical protein